MVGELSERIKFLRTEEKDTKGREKGKRQLKISFPIGKHYTGDWSHKQFIWLFYYLFYITHIHTHYILYIHICKAIGKNHSSAPKLMF